MANNFKVEIIHDLEGIDSEDYNVDVVVTLSDGRRFSGSFFTLKNVNSLMDKDSKTGECLNGLYFYTPDMVIVKRITEEIIHDTVGDLIENESMGSLKELRD